jgi:hypothetical protein
MAWLWAISHCAELAEIHDVAEQIVWDFKMRHKAEIADRLADWASDFDHIWSTRKENRIRVLTEQYEEYQELIGVLYASANLPGLNPNERIEFEMLPDTPAE